MSPGSGPGFDVAMTPRTRLVPVLASLTVVVALATGTASAQPAPEGKARPSTAAARAALADAQAVLSGTGGSRDATLTLLELWRQQGGLSAADQKVADELLARPDEDDSTCTPGNCYHWATTGPHAVDDTDDDGNGIPDYVDTVIETVDGVRQAYVTAGYRTPRADGVAGGNAKTDIYLEDTGAESLYGYCTSDQPIPNPPPSYDAWAYCVLDNDYDSGQFPTNTPLENLQVTAAHEYFHAVQFAYDAFEDGWFMEATATWAEDELYDDVDDNLQYLPNSPLTKPGRPLDSFSDGGEQYGAWIFFRFLTEGLPDEEGGLPVLVREMWERADGAVGGPDDYSIQAVERVLGDHGVSFPAAFGLFASANRLPRRSYEEGAAQGYPSTGPAGSFKLTASKKDSGWKFQKLAHLSAVTARFVPGRGLSSAKLKLAVKLPSATSVAVALVVLKSGQVRVVRVPASGKKVPFGSSKVKYVEVTLANAGTRYTCWVSGAYSCQGASLDDGRKLQVRGVAVR